MLSYPDGRDVDAGCGAAYTADFDCDGKCITGDVGAGNAQLHLVYPDQARHETAPVHDDAGFLDEGIAEIYVYGRGDGQGVGGRWRARRHPASRGNAEAGGV